MLSTWLKMRLLQSFYLLCYVIICLVFYFDVFSLRVYAHVYVICYSLYIVFTLYIRYIIYIVLSLYLLRISYYNVNL